MEQNTIAMLIDALKSIINKECEVRDVTIRKANKYGYVYFSKKDIGKKAKVLIYENDKRDIRGNGQADVTDELLPESEDLV